MFAAPEKVAFFGVASLTITPWFPFAANHYLLSVSTKFGITYIFNLLQGFTTFGENCSAT